MDKQRVDQNEREGQIEAAARVLRAGGLVAIPTETVYGLAADATDDRAVARIYDAKRRPSLNPLIVHVADAGTAMTLGRFDAAARLLAKRFWPGPLTIVVPLAADCPVSKLVSAGLATIALRVPAHPLARAVLAAADRPLAAPSANISGAVSPTRPEHVEAELADMVLDGGPCTVGLESTIVSCVDGAVRLLRPGGVPTEDLEQALGQPIEVADADLERPQAPGQLASHYAPRARLRLAATDVKDGEALLAFGPEPPSHKGPMRNLSPSGDLIEAAANLFAHLHDLDASGVGTIAVMPIPAVGLGIAINDRLTRAAAPRINAGDA